MRMRLFLLLALVMLPLLGFEIAAQIDLRRDRAADVRREAERLLDLIQAEQRRIVADVEHVLVAMAETGVAATGTENCQAVMDRLKRRYPAYLTIEITGLDGIIRCTTDRRTAGAHIGDRDNVRRALETGGFVVGGYRIAQGIGRPILSFGLPYSGPDGRPAGVVTALIDVQWLSEYLADKPLPPGATVLLADRNGIILAQAPELQGMTGRPLPAPYRFMQENDRRGTVEMEGLDGVVRIIAYSPVEADPHGLMLWVGISKAQAMLPVEHAMLRSLAILAAVLVLSGLLGVWGVSRFVRLQRQAEATRQRMAEVLESTHDAILEVDHSWRFTFLNERAKSLIARGHDVDGLTLLEAFPTLAGTDTWRRLAHVMEHRDACEFSHRDSRNGQCYAVRAFPSRTGMALYLQDITEREDAARARDRLARHLEEERLLLKAVLTHLPSGVLAVSAPSGRLLLHNEAAERLMGHTVEYGETITDYAAQHARHTDGTPYRPEDHPLARALDQGTAIDQEELLHLRADGRFTSFAVSAAPVRDAAGRIVMAICTFQDISERRRMDEALISAKERLALALEAAQAGSYDVDLRTGESVWSNELYRVLGLDPSAHPATMASWIGTLHPDDRERVLGERSKVVTGRLPQTRLEYRVVRPDGSVRWLEAVCRVVRADDGTPLHLTGLEIDVTDRHAMEDQLQRAKIEAERANLSKSKFLAAASHDLRQPMQSMFLFAGVLRGHVHNQRGQHALGMLVRGLDALQGLLDSLLDVSRLDAETIHPNFESAMLRPLLEQIGALHAPVAESKGLALHLDMRCDGAVRTDRHMLARMVRNLLENALRYTDHGFVRLSCEAVDGWARIAVQDSGIGIAANQMELIFEEFHQVGNPGRDRSQGLGLGLSIVQRLSKLLGHPVTVSSTPAVGSTFTVDVPLADAPPARPATPCKARAIDGAGRLAVLVDDDAIVLSGLQAIFQDWGYETLIGLNADDAVERLKEAGRAPDVIVADYRLQGGSTGIQAIHRLRDCVGADVSGILLTGESGTEWQREAAEHGLGVVIKPATPQQLGEALTRFPKTAAWLKGRQEG
ncbi:PAS domain-containing protein [Azospirillum argentinense]